MLPIRGVLKDMGVDYSCLDDDSDSGDSVEVSVLSKALTQGSSVIGFVPRRIELICTGIDGAAHAKSTDAHEKTRAASRITAHELLTRMVDVTADKPTEDTISRATDVQTDRQHVPYQQQSQPKQAQQRYTEPTQHVESVKSNRKALEPFDLSGLRQDLLSLKDLPTPVTAGIVVDDAAESTSDCQSMDTSVSYPGHSESGDGTKIDTVLKAEEQTETRIADESSDEHEAQAWFDAETGVDEVAETASAKDKVVFSRDQSRSSSEELLVMGKIPVSDALAEALSSYRGDDSDSDSASSGESVARWTEPVTSTPDGLGDFKSMALAKAKMLGGVSMSNEGSKGGSTSSKKPLSRMTKPIRGDADGPSLSKATELTVASTPKDVPVSDEDSILEEGTVAVNDLSVSDEDLILNEGSVAVNGSMSVDEVVMAEGTVAVKDLMSDLDSVSDDVSMSDDNASMSDGDLVSDDVSMSNDDLVSDEDSIVAEGTIPVQSSMPYEDEVLAEGSVFIREPKGVDTATAEDLEAVQLSMSFEEEVLIEGTLSLNEPILSEASTPEVNTTAFDKSMSCDEEVLVEGTVATNEPIFSESSTPDIKAMSFDKSMSFDEEVLVEGSIAINEPILSEASTPDKKTTAVEKSFSFDEEVLMEGTISAGKPPLEATPVSAEPPEPAADTVVEKQKRRIAPLLVTSVVPMQSQGNLVESQRTGLALVLPAEKMAADEARKTIHRTLGAGRGWSRRFPRLPRVRLGDAPLHVAAGIASKIEGSDTWWFRRSRSADQVDQADQRQMMHVWHWRYAVSVDRAIYGDFADESEAGAGAEEAAEDPVLAPYGEAATDGAFPEDLQREIDSEQKSAVQQAARAAAREAARAQLVRATIAEMEARFLSEWEMRILPRVAAKAHREWRKHVHRRGDLERLIEADGGVRLPKLEQAIVDSGVATRADIERMCGGLRVTVNELAHSRWLLALVDGPCPPPPPPASLQQQQPSRKDDAAANGVRRSRRAAESSSDGDGDSDGDSDKSSDGMGDFIDDADVEEPPVAADESAYMRLRPRRPQAVAEPRKNKRQPTRRGRGGKCASPKRPTAATTKTTAAAAANKMPKKRSAGPGAAIYAFARLRPKDIDAFKQYVQRRLGSEQCRASRVAALAWMRRRADVLGVKVDLSDMGVSDAEIVQAVAAAEQMEEMHVQAHVPHMSNEDFVQRLRRQQSADTAFDAIAWFVHRLATGRETHDALDAWRLSDGAGDAGGADGACKTAARFMGFRFAMRVHAEFLHWAAVFGDGSETTSVAGGGLVEARYADTARRDAALERIRQLLTRPGLRAEYAGVDLPRSERLVMFAQLAHVFVRCPEPRWGAVSGDRVPFSGGEARTAAMPRGSRALIVRRRWLPMLMRMVDDDVALARGAFAVYYAWRQSCSVDGDTRGMVKAAASADTDGYVDMSGDKKNDAVEDVIVTSGVLPRAGSARQSPAPGSAKSRRNIRAIREEDPATLAIQQRMFMQEKEIARKRQLMEAETRAVNVTTTTSTTSSSNKRQRIFDVSRSTASAAEQSSSAAGGMSVVVANPAATLLAEIDIDIDTVGRPVLVNPGHDDEQRDVFIPGFLAEHLKDHQIEGVRFLWKNVVMTGGGYQQHGCILAHAMGLGKTLQTITFVYTLLHEISITRNPDLIDSPFATRRVLILCPPTVQSNWASEFEKWTGVAHTTAGASDRNATSRLLQLPLLDSSCSSPPDPNYTRCLARAVQRRARRVLTQVANFDTMKSNGARQAALTAWHNFGGVMIMGYRMFVILMQRALTAAAPAENADNADATATASDVTSADFLYSQCLRRTLVEGGPCLVVADEGHVIKNPETQLSAMVNKLSTRARVCLTGYPLQNRLEEYWTMIHFCYPGFLGDLADFRNRYVNPINNGLYVDSTIADRHISSIRMHILQSLVQPVVDRRDAALLFSQLPRKIEFFISCVLTDVQRALYSAYLERVAGVGPLNPGTNDGVLAHGHMLLAICNHPAVFQQTIENGQTAQGQTNGGSASAVATPSEEDGSVETTEDRKIAHFIAAHDEWIREIYTTHHLLPAPTEDQPLAPPPLRITPEILQPTYSVKTQMALHIIRESINGGERVLVFSRSIATLDYLQLAIEAAGLAKLGQQMLRIDGTTVVGHRQDMVDRFNAAVSDLCVFLISSGTGSIGINLVSASRIIIFDVGWNPLYDEQAVARVYRYGQRRRVFVYRLMTTGTWEERLIRNNIFKVGLTRRVVDKQSMGRRVSKENAQRYLQHPPSHSEAISEAEAARVVADHHDDAVLSGLVAKFRPEIADIIPQATLLANEDEPLDEADLAEVNMSVHREKQRLGQSPLNTELKLDDPAVVSAFTPVTAPAAIPAVSPETISIVSPEITPQVAPEITPTATASNASSFALAVVPTNQPKVTLSAASESVPDATPVAANDTAVTSDSNNANIVMGTKIDDMPALRVLAMAEVAINRLEKLQVSGDEVDSCEQLRSVVSKWVRELNAYIYSDPFGCEARSETPVCQLGAQLGKLSTLYSILPLVATMDDDYLHGLFSLMKKNAQKT